MKMTKPQALMTKEIPMHNARPLKPFLSHYGLGIRLALGLAWLVWACATVVAQPGGVGAVHGFTLPEFYDPPNQNQLKTLVSGSQATFQPGGILRVTDLKAEMFRPTGEREVIIVSPECNYDTTRREGSSTNRLELQSGDGRVRLEGVGFLWRQNESTLIISNRVHTVIRLNPAPATTAKP